MVQEKRDVPILMAFAVATFLSGRMKPAEMRAGRYMGSVSGDSRRKRREQTLADCVENGLKTRKSLHIGHEKRYMARFGDLFRF